MNNNDSTMSYREQVEAARAPFERGSAKYVELADRLGKRDDAARWISFIEEASPRDLGETYYLFVFQPGAEFVGEAPAWADPTTVDYATRDGLPVASWGRMVFRSEEVEVSLSRSDEYDPDSRVTTAGDTVLFVSIADQDSMWLPTTTDLRKIAAGLLNGADEIDKLGAL